MPLPERVAVATLCAALLTSCAGRPQAVQPTPAPAVSKAAAPAEPAYHLFETGAGAKTPFVKNYVKGALVYSLKAAGVTFNSARKTGAFAHATIYFYKGSTVRLTVSAPTADVDGGTYDIVMRGGVHARSSDGTTLTSDTMTYNGKSKMLHALGHVTATGTSGMVVTGDQATADLDLQTVDITGGPVTGEQRR